VLIPTADGKGRCAALEVLLRTPGLPNVIREGNTSMLNSIIQSGRAQGMQTLDGALAALVSEGKIRNDEAYLRATDKSKFGAAAA
jgi:twitching motility protein PilT